MDKTLHDMFVLTLPVVEKMLRPIVVYAFLIVGLLTWPAMPQTVPDEFLRVHRQGIGPIKLGMALEDITRALGKPISLDFRFDDGAGTVKMRRTS